MDEVYRYHYEKGFEKIESSEYYEEIDNEDDYYVMYLSKEGFREFAKHYDFDETVQNLISSKNTNKAYIIVEDNYTFSTIELLDAKNNDNDNYDADLIGFYIEKNRLMIIDVLDKDESTEQAFKEIIDSASLAKSPGRFINTFLNKVVVDHTEIYDKLRTTTAEIEDRIVENNVSDDEIITLSDLTNRTLKLYTSYERILDLVEVLIDNENKIFDDDDVKHIKSFSRRIERYSSNISYLSNYINSVKESHATFMNMKLNDAMKILTIVTTIFTPLSFIAGWYGMNFTYMPELDWQFGYLYVIILAIVAVFPVILMVKKLDL